MSSGPTTLSTKLFSYLGRCVSANVFNHAYGLSLTTEMVPEEIKVNMLRQIREYLEKSVE